MKIQSELRLIQEFEAYTSAPGGGATEQITVPLYHGVADFAESELEGILFTGDLQFYDRQDVPEEDRVLMGHIVAREIAEFCDIGLLPPRDRLGVVLTGDFFADACLLRRGGTGDVEDVWLDFAERYRWVVGVAGNHDLFEGQAAFPCCLRSRSNAHPLHGDAVSLDGLSIAGISGIVGNPRKPWRNTEPEWLTMAKTVLNESHDIFVLHEGPTGSQKGQRGRGYVDEGLQAVAQSPAIVALGHCHWHESLDVTADHTYLNVDGCAALITRRADVVKL